MLQAAYGNRIAKHFLLEDAPAFTVQTPRRSTLAVTRIRTLAETGFETLPVPPEDAFIVTVQVRDLLFHRRWVDGHEIAAGLIPKGGVSIIDLRRDSKAWIGSQLDEIQFYIPRSALDELADSQGIRRVASLDSPNGRVDSIVARLGDVLLPALEEPGAANTLFNEQITLAVQSHVAQTYGGVQIAPRVVRSGLAPWQQRRAKEMLLSYVSTNGSLAAVARECRLSPSHFSRAFRRSIGESPHRWLAARRMDRAKSLLLQSDKPIVRIALDCGFTDQAYFTKVFSNTVGVSPGAWRRSRRQHA